MQASRHGWCVLVLLLFHLVAAESSTNNTDEDSSPFSEDFSNNVFSDLGPIIALFGEKFANQYLSEAYSVWDCVIFATAPLGVISAIVAAIRVAGPVWMRAVIGRARENRASAELELMSSTSRDVGELWNGESIVRSMGRPSVLQLILIWSEINDPKTFGLYTLKTALEEGKMSHHDYNGPSWSSQSREQANEDKGMIDSSLSVRSKPSKTPSMSVVQDDTEQTAAQFPMAGMQNLPEFDNNPNISLNLHHGSGLAALVAAATTGIILQCGVVVYAGAVTFNPWLRKRVPPHDDDRPHLAMLGFVLLASGTVILTISLAIVCNVIETSTSEREWVVNNPRSIAQSDNTTATPGQLRVMWVQREHTVGDQLFDAAVLFAKNDKDTVLTSRRSERLADRIDRDQLSIYARAQEKTSSWRRIAHDQTEWATLLSTIACLIGFIMQFQGLRYVNWSCSLVQLGAIFVMTLVRAVLRRGLVARPQALEVPLPNHELDKLTVYLISHPGYFGDSARMGNETKTRLDKVPLVCTFAYHGDLQEEGTHVNEKEHQQGRNDDVNQAHGDRMANETAVVRQYDHGNMALAIRSRLQILTKWENPMSVYAQALSVAIQLVLNKFVHEGTSFVWTLDLPGCDFRKRITQYRITIERGDSTSRDWDCEDLALTLESVLSLWLLRINEIRQWREDARQYKTTLSDATYLDRTLGRASPQDSYFILGPEIGTQLRDDISRWTGREFRKGSYDLDEERSTSQTRRTTANAVDMTLGIRGIRQCDPRNVVPGIPLHRSKDQPSNASTSTDQPVDDPPTDHLLPNGITSTLRIPWSASTERYLSQHVFANFMWSVANSIPRERLGESSAIPSPGFKVSDPFTWTNCRIESTNLSALMNDMQKHAEELGGKEDIANLIIPSLSRHDLLPHHSLAEIIIDFAGQFSSYSSERGSMDYTKAGIRLHKIFEAYAYNYHMPSSEASFYAIVAAFQEFRLDAINYFGPPQDLQYQRSVGWMSDYLHGQEMQFARTDIAEDLETTVNDIGTLYEWQRRAHMLHRIEYRKEREKERHPIQEDERLHRHFRYTDWHIAITRGSETDETSLAITHWALHHVLAADILGWTPLHYAVAYERAEIVKDHVRILSQANEDAPKDFSGRTPMHYAVMQEYPNSICRHLMNLKSWAVKDRCGMTPLHWAAKAGNAAVIPLLCWPLKRPREIEDVTLDKSQAEDLTGRTPSHWAAISGSVEVLVTLTLQMWDMKTGDLHGDTPLHHAARLDNEKAVRWLLAEQTTDQPGNLVTENKDGKTALDEAPKGSKSREVLEEAMVARHNGEETYAAFIEKMELEFEDEMDAGDERVRLTVPYFTA